jgi:hypothetical protein
MDNLPTSEKAFENFFNSFPKYGTYLAENWKKEICAIADNLAKEKSKIYVEAALKIASEKAKTKSRKKTFKASSGSEYDYIISVDKKSILNAFPLTDIK